MTASTSESNNTRPNDQRPWPMWLMLTCAWVLPLRALRNDEHLRDWQAWLIHIWGLFLTVLIWLAIILAVEAIPHSTNSRTLYSLETWWGQFIEKWMGLGNAIGQTPWVSGAFILIVLATFELGLVLVAWLFMAIGVRPGESIGSAWWRSLRRLWVMTPWLGAYSVLLIGVVGVLEALRVRWRYDLVLREIKWDDRPLYIRDPEYVFGVVLVLVCLIALLVVWRGLLRGQGGARCRWPALCRRCGYLLLGLSRDQLCPECGLQVSQSLSPDARLGTAWQRRKRDGRSWIGALIRAWVTAIFRPSRVGAEMRCGDPAARSGDMLTIASVAHFLLAATGMFLAIWIVGRVDRQRFWELIVSWEMPLMFFLVGAAIMGIALGLVLLSSSLMGTTFASFKRQHVLTATWHGANHLNGWLLVLHAVGWASFTSAVVLINSRWARSLAESIDVHHELLYLSLFLVSIFVGLVIYLVLLWRITLAARNANA